jgi:hypothetical protein
LHVALKLHPDSRCTGVTEIGVDLQRGQSGQTELRYTVSGTIASIQLPQIADPLRADHLWQTTCFEAFLRDPGSGCYFEFNLSPSTRWAAYQFSDYRKNMRELAELDPPQIEMDFADDSYVLRAWLDVGALSRQPETIRWQLGLSAVIEERSGLKSYWALAHPPGKPDLHHRDCFTLELPIAE